MMKTRLKQLRQEKELTQTELANKLNISQGSVAMYESGKRIPENNVLILLSKFFDVSTDYLLGLTDIRKYSEDILAFNSTEGLTEDDLRIVHQMIQNLRDKNQSKK